MVATGVRQVVAGAVRGMGQGQDKTGAEDTFGSET